MAIIRRARALRRGPALLAAAAVLAVATGAAWSVAASRDGQGPTGNGFTYRGEFYFLSSAEVRDTSLGPVLDRAVAYQDGIVDVRRIRGVDPGTAVAAHTGTFPGTGSTEERGWLLLSPDGDLGADPWSDEKLAAVVLPPAPR